MMKRILSLVALLIATKFSYAQWTLSGSNITTSNNVGIGTTSPAFKLDVQNGNASIYNNGNITQFAVGGLTGKTQINLSTSSDVNGHGILQSVLVGGSSYGNTVINPYGGYVGVGTHYPKKIFHVVIPMSKTTVTSPTDENAASFLSTNDPSAAFGLRTMIYGGPTIYARFVTLQTTEFNTQDGGNINLQPAAGLVGIGTVSPGSMLQVDDGCTKANIGDASGQTLNYGTSYLGFNAARSGSNWTLHTDGNNNGGGIAYADIYGNYYIASIPSTGTANQTLSDAQVASKIQFKVDATGTTHAKKIIVQASLFPDYVFKPTYHLRPLSEVEAYIDQHQHLPEVPSATTVEKEGMDVAEMNKILLKKVEELTLYLIQKDDENHELSLKLKSLAQKVDDLSKKINNNN